MKYEGALLQAVTNLQRLLSDPRSNDDRWHEECSENHHAIHRIWQERKAKEERAAITDSIQQALFDPENAEKLREPLIKKEDVFTNQTCMIPITPDGEG